MPALLGYTIVQLFHQLFLFLCTISQGVLTKSMVLLNFPLWRGMRGERKSDLGIVLPSLIGLAQEPQVGTEKKDLAFLKLTFQLLQRGLMLLTFSLLFLQFIA